MARVAAGPSCRFSTLGFPHRRNKRARRNAQLNGVRPEVHRRARAASPRRSSGCSRTMSDMHVAIIDYGSGNLHSAAKAFERAAHDQGSKLCVMVTAEPEEVLSAQRIVLPGVGAFADCRQGLGRMPGMIEALVEAVQKRGKPFLGICVGLQLMAERGVEHGVTPGLGWIAGEVRAIETSDSSLKIPHMGWNTLKLARTHALFDGIPTGEQGRNAYFVHSYHLVPSDRRALVATTDYGGEVTAFVAKDNIAGSQFHPEKSQKLGLALISNFLKWKP